MKKKILLSLGLLASAGVMSFAALSGSASPAKASNQHYTIVSDSFNDPDYAGSLNTRKWSSYTDKSDAIIQESKGISYVTASSSKAACDWTYFGTRHVIHDVTSFQVDFKFTSACNRWLAISIQNKDVTKDGFDSSAGYYNGLFTATYTGLCQSGIGCSEIEEGGINFTAATGCTAVDKWMTVRVDVITSTTAKISVSAQGEEANPDYVRTLTLTKSSLSLTDAAIGVQSSGDAGEYCLDNFSVTSSSGTISTDFSSINFDDNQDLGFVTTQTDLPYTLVDSSMLTLANAEKDDLIATNSVVQKDTTILGESVVTEASFYAEIPENSPDKVGIVFGVGDESKSTRLNTVVYEISAGTGVLKEYTNGEQTTEDGENTNVLNYLSTGSIIDIKIWKSGKVEITENETAVRNTSGAAATFSTVSNYAGSFGITALTDMTTAVCIDNVLVTNNIYYIPVTKSVTHNFSNDFWGNKGYEDFYCQQVGGGSQLYVSEGRLVWDRATDGNFFGSAHQYDCFILDFKITSIKCDMTSTDSRDATAKDKWIGLDLSRSAKAISYYGSYMTVITPLTQDPSTPNQSFMKWEDKTSTLDLDTVTYDFYNSIPVSYFTAIQYSEDSQKSSISEGDAVCMRYVSDGSSIKLYMKKACETEFTLYQGYSNLQMNGYFAICCTGYTYMEIDDFSMSNTSSMYVCADNYEPETITNTEIHTIFDTTGYDINWEEEKKLNAGCSGSVAASSSILAVLSLAGLTLVGVAVRGRKKHE